MPNQNQISATPGAQSQPAYLPNNQFYIQTPIGGGVSPYNVAKHAVVSKKNGIIIDAWTPGDNDQIWQFNANGSISPANDLTMVLTAQSTSPTSGNQVTLELFDSSNQTLTPAQIWYQSNNRFWVDMGGSIGNQYLNLYNAENEPGTIIQTYELVYSDCQIWYIVPATPIQAASNNFYIQTGLSGDNVNLSGQSNPYVLANNNGIVIDQWAPGDTSQIWMLNGDGSIRSFSDATSILTAQSTSPTSGNQVTLEPFDGTLSAAQIWYQSDNQFWVDMGGSIGKVYLNVNGADLAAGTQVITYEPSTDPNEQWYLFPATPVLAGEWFYLKTEMTNNISDRSTYVMAVSGTSVQAGSPVVIEPWNPGAANQLWKMTDNGNIVSGLNLELGLASTAGGYPVTLQSTTGSGYWLQWYLTGNNMLATGPSGSVYFLNVKGGGNAAAGTSLITYGSTSGANEVWTPLPYEPSGLWFTIRNSAYAQSGPLSALLTLTMDGDITLSPPIGGQIIPTGQAAKSQLWRKTIDGYIMSATHPNLVLTAQGSGEGLIVALAEPGNDKQKWFSGLSQFDPIEGIKKNINILAGTIENVALGQFINNSALLAPLLPPPLSGDYLSSELWYIIPHAMPFGESTTIRNTAGGKSDGLFLTLADKAVSGVYQINVGAIPDNSSFSMWRYEFPGYIVSNVDDNIVLSLELGSGNTAGNPVYIDNVVAYPRQAGDQLFQLWTVREEGMIVSQYDGKPLMIPEPASPPASTLNVGTFDSGYQIWDFSPGMALQTVLQQPAIGFPPGSAEEQNIYDSICKELGLPDGIRSQYQNLAAPLAGYQSAINLMATGKLVENIQANKGTPPASAEPSAYQTVVTQLNKEIIAACAVRQLFEQATSLYLSLSQAQAIMLSELITDCALPEGVKVSPPKKNRSWIGDLVEGILYTGMNVAGSFVGDPAAGKEASLMAGVIKNGLPCFANLMATAFTTGQSALTGGSGSTAKLQATEQNIYNYEMTVSQLQQALLNEFEELGTFLGQIEALILGDWYKLQAVYEMCYSYGDMFSLYWPSTMTAKDTDQMLSVYAQGVLKTLIPANKQFDINASMHINYKARLSPGWHSGSFYINNDDGTQNSYSTNLSSNLMNLIWAVGTNANAFFLGLNGWELPATYQGILAVTGAENTLPGAASCLVNIQNFTNVALGVQIQMNYLVESSYAALSGTGKSIPIAPYGVVQIAGGALAVIDELTSGGTAKNYYGVAMGPSKTPGITITVGSPGTTIVQFDVDNSYKSANSKAKVSEIPSCIYSIANFVRQEPFNCVIKIQYETSGMAFINVIVTVN